MHVPMCQNAFCKSTISHTPIIKYNCVPYGLRNSIHNSIRFGGHKLRDHHVTLNSKASRCFTI